MAENAVFLLTVHTQPQMGDLMQESENSLLSLFFI